MSGTDRFLVLPPFHPPWWLSGGHRQTLAAAYWFGDLADYRAVPRQITLNDGDIVVIHDDCPETWRPGQRVALLMHGLSGSHQSPLLVRLATKLTRQGVRVFRWDLRGCGAGVGLARFPYHAGRSDDLDQVIRNIVNWCSPEDGVISAYLSLFGVSLSGNILLKYLGETPDRVPRQVSQAISVNPPIDLLCSVSALGGPLTSWYDRHFVAKLSHDLKVRRLQRPDAPMPESVLKPRGLMQFDDWYTAPVSGYSTAHEYYSKCSAKQFMPHIRVPTTVITSSDDPMVPLSSITSTADQWGDCVRLAVASGGGHVGYIARRGPDPDEFWLDWRIVDLITSNAHA